MQLEEHIRHFLYDQENHNSDIFGMDVELDACPLVFSTLRISVAGSALYHAPSDLSGIGAMHRGYIRATPSWMNVGMYIMIASLLIEKDADEVGFRALCRKFPSARYGAL